MQTDKEDKPKWLRRLERESWQAELIISGAAILGTLQLPGLLEQFQFYLLLNFDRSALMLWFFATSYWALFVYLLIILFILHFVVRALWIGLVGLNSVYPDGIAETKLTSKDYQEKIQEEYGDIDGFINKLDLSASGMFGTGFTLAGLFLNLGIIVSLSVLLVTWLQRQGLEATMAWIIGLSPIIIIFSFSLISSLLALPALREREWVKTWHFPVQKLLSRLTYPVNTRFTITGLMLLSSQSAAKAKSVSEYVGSFIVSMLLFAVVGFALSASGALKSEFVSDVYHRLGDAPTDVDPKNYADNRVDQLLLEPQLSSYSIEENDVLWLWVPLPERELTLVREACNEAEVDEALEKPERRKLARARLMRCAQPYIDLYLNDERIPTPLPKREFRESVGMSQFGVRLELTDKMPEVGPHLFKIVTHYPKESGETENYRTTYIPFVVTRR